MYNGTHKHFMFKIIFFVFFLEINASLFKKIYIRAYLIYTSCRSGMLLRQYKFPHSFLFLCGSEDFKEFNARFSFHEVEACRTFVRMNFNLIMCVNFVNFIIMKL